MRPSVLLPIDVLKRAQPIGRGRGVLGECDFLFNFLLWREQMILLNSGYSSHNRQILKEGSKFTSFETSKIKT